MKLYWGIPSEDLKKLGAVKSIMIGRLHAWPCYDREGFWFTSKDGLRNMLHLSYISSTSERMRMHNFCVWRFGLKWVWV